MWNNSKPHKNSKMCFQREKTGHPTGDSPLVNSCNTWLQQKPSKPKQPNILEPNKMYF